MRILIIGLGYAGTRFLHAFQNVSPSLGSVYHDVAYVGRSHRRTDLKYFEDLPSALSAFKPDLVVLSVNDVYHAEVGEQLAAYQGFVLCEKPLVCPSDNMYEMEKHLTRASGFCLNLIERYSPISKNLRQFVQDHKLELLRANFIWGKDRLGDHRPTCGVTSEIIHPLDLVQHISGVASEYQIVSAHGVRSDFSVSGLDVPDSISILACLGTAPVTGYASFVNVSRRREIGFIFGRRTGGLVFANTIFDDPAWDDDHLKIWESSDQGERVLLEQRIKPETTASGQVGISKLVRVAEDIHNFVNERIEPSVPFPACPQRFLFKASLTLSMKLRWWVRLSRFLNTDRLQCRQSRVTGRD